MCVQYMSACMYTQYIRMYVCMHVYSHICAYMCLHILSIVCVTVCTCMYLLNVCIE